jgi:hypothetical protein
LSSFVMVLSKHSAASARDLLQESYKIVFLFGSGGPFSSLYY